MQLFSMAVWCLAVFVVGNVVGAETKTKKADPDDNKGNAPFFLQDDSDRCYTLLFILVCLIHMMVDPCMLHVYTIHYTHILTLHA